MTNIYVSYKTVAMAAVVAFGAIAFSSIGANASTTNDLRLCHANSKERFVKCCETVISHKPKPLWFMEHNSSCQTVVACKRPSQSNLIFAAAVVPYRCNLQIPQNDNQGSGTPGERKGRQIQTYFGKD